MPDAYWLTIASLILVTGNFVISQWYARRNEQRQDTQYLLTTRRELQEDLEQCREERERLRHQVREYRDEYFRILQEQRRQRGDQGNT